LAGQGEDAHEEARERALDVHGATRTTYDANRLSAPHDLAFGGHGLGRQGCERAVRGRDHDPLEHVETLSGKNRLDGHAGTLIRSVAMSGLALRASPVRT